MLCDLISVALLWFLGLGLLMLALALMLYLWRITVAIGLLMLAALCIAEPRVFYVIVGMAGGLVVILAMSYLTDKNKPC